MDSFDHKPGPIPAHEKKDTTLGMIFVACAFVLSALLGPMLS